MGNSCKSGVTSWKLSCDLMYCWNVEILAHLEGSPKESWLEETGITSHDSRILTQLRLEKDLGNSWSRCIHVYVENSDVYSGGCRGG